jgi:DNA-binding beta-propeller fold protein YncE
VLAPSMRSLVAISILAFILVNPSGVAQVLKSSNLELRLVRQVGPELTEGVVMAGPFGISISASGTIYVADDLAHQIYVLDTELRYLRSIGKHGANAGEFSYPDAAVEGADGLLYVADTGNNRVQIITPDGRHIRTVSRFGWLRTRFRNPRAIKFGTAGQF